MIDTSVSALRDQPEVGVEQLFSFPGSPATVYTYYQPMDLRGTRPPNQHWVTAMLIKPTNFAVNVKTDDIFTNWIGRIQPFKNDLSRFE